MINPASETATRSYIEQPDNLSNWDFSDVPPEQQAACAVWEYARESKTMRFHREHKELFVDAYFPNTPPTPPDERSDAIAKLEALRKDFGYDPMRFNNEAIMAVDLSHAFGSIGAGPENVYGAFATINEDLSTRRQKWTDLPLVKRKFYSKRCPVKMGRANYKDAIALIRHARSIADGYRFDLHEEAEYLTSYGPLAPIEKCKGLIIAAFKINVGGCSRTELIRAFGNWLDELPMELRPGTKGQGHKPKDFQAVLTRLAVMRLLHRYTPAEILGTRNKQPLAECKPIMESTQFQSDKWGDPAKWLDARREAKVWFRKLLPFLPPNELPFSWVTKGQRPK